MVYARHWGMKVFTFMKGRLKGEDEAGNKYYQERFWGKSPKRKPRRWVMYQGILEGSSVSAEWFGWLHHDMDEPLPSNLKNFWQKPHQPNLTGTPLAYHPGGNFSKDGAQRALPQSYEPWQPSEK